MELGNCWPSEVGQVRCWVELDPHSGNRNAGRIVLNAFGGSWGRVGNFWCYLLARIRISLRLYFVPPLTLSGNPRKV
jgi:hypothetical protein